MTETLSALDQVEATPKVHLRAVPKHVAIIMDGNRRWAKIHNMPVELGHWGGAERITQIVTAASSIGVKTLTVFAFSTENWARPKSEVKALMHLFRVYLQKMRQVMVDKGVRLDTIGDLSALPKEVVSSIERTKEATSECTAINLVLAINYGGRDDLTRAAGKIYDDIQAGKVKREAFNENLFSKYVDTAKWGDPELLIRTSGESRISNFLLWQLSYAEVYIAKTLWPDFTEAHFLEAIEEYRERDRRGGE